MNRHPVLILLLSLTLLFSMTEIYKVTMLGVTVLTDVEKAAHFCTCAGCSHSNDGMPKTEDSEHTMNGMEHQDIEEKPSHCSTNGAESGKPAVCGCSTSSEKEIPILYNSLDKVALLSTVKTNQPSEKKRVLFAYQNREAFSLSKDIFHPPKTS